MPKTRVVVVDDSALVRRLLAEIIDRQPDMECIGAASDPYQAREIIRATNPDVITLDVEMPRMDGIDFLGKLMRLRPTPVVMVSTLTERGAEVTLRALELGAVDPPEAAKGREVDHVERRLRRRHDVFSRCIHAFDCRSAGGRAPLACGHGGPS